MLYINSSLIITGPTCFEGQNFAVNLKTHNENYQKKLNECLSGVIRFHPRIWLRDRCIIEQKKYIFRILL